MHKEPMTLAQIAKEEGISHQAVAEILAKALIKFKKALAKKNWTPELLDKWLEDPQNVAAGTYMMYQQPDASVRTAIIDYLKTVK